MSLRGAEAASEAWRAATKQSREGSAEMRARLLEVLAKCDVASAVRGVGNSLHVERSGQIANLPHISSLIPHRLTHFDQIG